jgi:maltooligosyltrehalose trehalohydrolase
MSWQPSLGAWPEGEGTRFRVWAPEARSVQVVLEGSTGGAAHPLQRSARGFWSAHLPGVRPGDRYRYRVDQRGAFPDLASRFQPEGVHGPSEIVDPRAFAWTDAGWRNVPRQDLVVYELHVGTFSPEGTFAGAEKKLDPLTDLGVNAIELMPLADFPGNRGWGYDGVCLYAPARCYGRPDDLRRLVDAAHRRGLAVLLDVVYNHLGPDGNYTGVYSPYYSSKRSRTPWGDALNFDGTHSASVRDFFIENALHWLHEYHFDGLRVDATHAIRDESPRHFLAELTGRARESLPGRAVHLIAEDHGNLVHMLRPESEGGWGFDGLWADDFHHQLRRLLAGDCESYYRDFSGTVDHLVTTIQKGWFFCGQFSEHLQRPRGTDPQGLPPRSLVVCLQNHDQVGNRALGQRLHHQVDLAAWRAASALLLCSPATPLLFMGQEWAASSPFLFFTDHHRDLGRRVTEGRRHEFRHFSAFADPATRERIPDPQAVATFEASRLDWSERARPPHAGVLALYRELLRLRRTEPALRATGRDSYAVTAIGDSALALLRRASDGPALLLVCRLRGSGPVRVSDRPLLREYLGRRWDLVLTTEEALYAVDPQPPTANLSSADWGIDFRRPSAMLLRAPS